MRKTILLFVSAFLLSCGASKETANKYNYPDNVEFEPEIIEQYNGSYKRTHDLIHSDISIRFDWSKQHALGQASLKVKPYFYSSNQLTLNAKGMDIHKVYLLSGDSIYPLAYNYINDSIFIQMDKIYTRLDTFEVQVNYTSKPNDLVTTGSSAFSSAKGLYFINPLGEDKNKPTQIWTQGETQASSCWFPTIDAPNERMTQDMRITVDKKYVTLSNGLLIKSEENTDGTRTDHWNQNLPAAPYLSMLAVGEYEIVKDKWRDLEVSYYMEQEYEKMGRTIYGHTPEMLEFFSNVLGVDYPWAKYSQIAVRDYVSGAMENTTAVIFGEFMNQDRRSMLDYDNEDVISHELFHHWFGDLVTCESWSNLPLNESFATYGEYLWNEFKYGSLKADHYGYDDLQAYIRESKRKQEPLIRFKYDHQDEMFDAHSYQKGGRVLHMLRKYVGDEAFFSSLQLYLEDNKFESVEIHDLRLAFEKVTGEDLNWFFNQWFLSSGHPFIDISYDYNDSLKKQTVTIEQLQDLDNSPLFKLPIDIDIYETDVPKRFRVTMNKQRQEFSFFVSKQPKLVNVDAEKMLLCEKIDNKTTEELVFQYYSAPNYLDRREAINAIGNEYEVNGPDGRMIKRALSDPYWHLRLLAVGQLEKYIAEDPQEMKEVLSYMATNDKKSLVRAEALSTLSQYYRDDESVMHVFKNATVDSSYTVLKEGLMHFTYLNKEAGLQIANKYAAEQNPRYVPILSSLYSKYGNEIHHLFFDYAFRVTSGNSKYRLLKDYGRYLTNCDFETIEKGLGRLKLDAVSATPWYVRLAAVEAMTDVLEHTSVEKQKLQKEVDSKESTSIMKKDAELNLEKCNRLELAIERALDSIKKNEKHNRLQQIYNKG